MAILNQWEGAEGGREGGGLVVPPNAEYTQQTLIYSYKVVTERGPSGNSEEHARGTAVCTSVSTNKK